MRVLIVNTSEQIGGAAIAASRLCESLNNNGVKAKMLVRDRQTDNLKVVSLESSWMNRMRFLWERGEIYMANRFSKDNLFAIDTGSQGVDITSLREFQEADVIHLHWVNQGFLSLKGIDKILKSGKRVVWTMHDMWPCTSICHHAGNCPNYETHCRQCPLLKSPGDKDLSYKVFEQKEKMYREHRIKFVTCSHWLEEQATKSYLLRGQNITTIANALDTHMFCPGDQQEARASLRLPKDERMILFGALRVTDKRKGIDYLLEAAKILKGKFTKDDEKIAFVVMGREADQMQSMLPFPVHSMGYVSSPQQLAEIYRAVDMFVTPSLFENLPNTIAEAMSCGTPCVAFRVGGIPEMIDHQDDGYLAEYKNSEDLARGIRYVLDTPELGDAAHHYAAHQYDENRVANEYIKIYEK